MRLTNYPPRTATSRATARASHSSRAPRRAATRAARRVRRRQHLGVQTPEVVGLRHEAVGVGGARDAVPLDEAHKIGEFVERRQQQLRVCGRRRAAAAAAFGQRVDSRAKAALGGERLAGGGKGASEQRE